MNIDKQILNEVISVVIKEQDMSLMNNSVRTEYLKKLLLYVEYISRYYKVINDHINNAASTQLSTIEIYEQTINFLKTIISDPDFIQIQNALKSLTTNSDQEFGKLLPTLSNSLQNLVTFLNSYNNTLPEEEQIHAFTSFIKDFRMYSNSISKILNNIRTKFSDISTKNVSNKPLPELSTVSYVNDLENISLVYLSEIEALFKKFDNIRIESGEYAKKWEDFNILRGHNMYAQGIGVVNDPNPEISDKIKRFMANYTKKHLSPNMDVMQSAPYSFNIGQFIQILQTGKYKANPKEKYPTREIQKAQSIQQSLSKIFGWDTVTKNVTKNSIEGTLQEKFKEIHAKLWDANSGKYLYDSELRQIFQILFNVRRLYKKTLNNIITKMHQMKDKSLPEVFSKIGPIIDAIVKYVQFGKLNIRNVLLNLITNSGVNIDVARYQTMFSKQNDETVAKRLAYWSLFQRLGWTKGLKNEEPPEWMYGNAIKSEPTVAASP